MHTRYACSKQRCKNSDGLHSLDLNPIEHLLDLSKRKVCAQPLQLNLRELRRAIHQMCAIPQQYIHRYILSMSTHYLAVDATPGGCTKY